MAKKTPLRRSKRNRKVETSSSEEEEEELDADDEEKARQLEDIRKIFEIFDERGEGNEDEAPKDEEESFDPNA